MGGVGISLAAGVAAGGFALTATHFSRRRSAGPAKSKQKALPRRSAPRWGSGFLRYGIDPGAAATVCFAAPPSAVYDFVVRSLRSHARINPFTQPAEGAKDQEQEQEREQEQNQKPLTLALSRRERGLTAVDARDTPTCDTESNAKFRNQPKSAPSPRGEGWGEGQPHHKSKANRNASNHSIQ
ncbi:hypothetical protein SAMN05216579_1302 [Pseudomonas granadensis]|nr:hypothetical protein SAMN05216579_1302 [Pseudomonas granadensis]